MTTFAPDVEDMRAVLGAVLDERRQDWRRLAVCRGQDPELFFPTRGTSCAEAKRVCFGCPVRDDCLNDA